MDIFETPYDESTDIEYITCEICDKSIRGETLYKLHVTSQAHLKNEQTLVAEGKISRLQPVPYFEDLIQYLEYLKIDEPIVGLDYLFEVEDEGSDPSFIKYNCTLCKVYAPLTEAVQHVIGRKHRQKYLENNRPDLVNWDPQRPHNLAGKLMRAKAEIAERQDGSGKPTPLSNKKGLTFPRLSVQGGPNNGRSSSYRPDMGTRDEGYPKGPRKQWSDKSDFVRDRQGNERKKDFPDVLGGPSSEEQVVRKKSRFSNATADEIQAAYKMFSKGSARTEIQELKRQKMNRSHLTENEQRESLEEFPESAGDVFEMLRNIEIENEEEAHFLKERLRCVLMEFKARKAEKALQTGQSRGVIIKEYNMRPASEQHFQDHYGQPPRGNPSMREKNEDVYGDPRHERYQESIGDFEKRVQDHLSRGDLQIRRSEDVYDDPRLGHQNISGDSQVYQRTEPNEGRSEPFLEYQQYEQHKEMSEGAHEYQRFGLPDVQYSNRNAHKEMQRWPSDQPSMTSPFPKMYQEPSRPQDYELADKFSDYPSTASLEHVYTVTKGSVGSQGVGCGLLRFMQVALALPTDAGDEA
uniref:C2H2-type domain-containing protein n=1 Tax=Knipowitschia caucasica TaxID=637954 RepID=A0AAV2K915_KNICA